ncbi:MAG TPA: hypothetical protein VFO65_03715 [Acidimicrobiales bacterium]|nr:hypothetical protein [Acidimicrobiales bacterium]
MTEERSRAGDVVVLPDVPVRLFLESQDHQHDLIRELQLIHLGQRFDVGTDDVSRELAELIAGILSRYREVRTATRDQALAALDRGDERVTLSVPVREGMAEALQRWLELLEQADRLCREGELLQLAARPEIRGLRHWYVERLVAALTDR